MLDPIFYLCVMHQSFATTPPPGDSGGIAGLKYCNFIFEVSWKCRGYAGLLILGECQNSGRNSCAFYRVLPDLVRCFDKIFAGI